MDTQISKRIDGFKGLGIMLASMLIVAGCADSSSSKKQQNPNQEKPTVAVNQAGFVGTWAPKDFMTAAPAENTQNTTLAVKIGYWFLNVSPELAVQSESQGLYTNNERDLDLISQNMGALQIKNDNQAALMITDEYINELKKQGATEEAIKGWSTCVLNLKSENEMEFNCPDQPGEQKTTALVRVSSEDKQKIQTETQKGIDAIKAKREELLKSLAGKKYQWISGQIKTTDKNGKEQVTLTKPSELPEESGADASLIVNPKVLVFSENLDTVKLNEKWDSLVDVTVSADLNSAILDVRRVISDTEVTSQVYGVIAVEEHGFSVTWESFDQETQTKSVATKVFVRVD